MNQEQDLPLIFWPISCFDRRRENPLPVYSRWYWLDWTRTTSHQIAEILAIINGKAADVSPHVPVGFDESVITMSIDGANHDIQMLNFRHLFVEVPDNNLKAFFNNHPLKHRGFQTVSVAVEYFEDESGTPISNYEIIQHVTGKDFPIIVGNAESVLRLGPIPATNTSNWSKDKANTIEQFLDVVERIHASGWYRSPRFITTLSNKVGDTKLLEAEYPDDENTTSVLAYFRQLHAGDKLLEKACDVYIAHAGDARKRWWVNERKRSFASLVDSTPEPYNTRGKTRRQIVRMFMYGAGLLHSLSQHGDDAALKAFTAAHGKYEAVMIFNSCLMEFFEIAATIYPVLSQDYKYWVSKNGLCAASRVQIPKLFEGFTSPPHGK